MLLITFFAEFSGLEIMVYNNEVFMNEFEDTFGSQIGWIKFVMISHRISIMSENV